MKTTNLDSTKPTYEELERELAELRRQSLGDSKAEREALKGIRELADNDMLWDSVRVRVEILKIARAALTKK